MGRGRRSATARRTAATAGLPQAVFPLPPWPEPEWAEPPHSVTEIQLGDGEALRELLDSWGLAAGLADAEAQGLGAVVSGGSFDNACGSRVLRGEDWQIQELSAYLLRDGKPEAELNLANLCAWATAKERRQGHSVVSPRIRSARDLAAFADGEGLRPDWHEPDEQEVTACARGHRLDRSPEGLMLELCRAVWDEAASDYLPGEALAEVFLVDLLDWGSGWEAAQPPPGPRVRLSALGE